uniref:F-box domain-containing protein n=1 Tax=Steinernema glaseri TaxID=37863 RepID=A0A1I7Z1I1_9BILA
MALDEEVQNAILLDLKDLGAQNLPEIWEYNAEKECYCLEFTRILDNSDVPVRLVMSFLKDALTEEAIGVVVNGFIQDAEAIWTPVASLSLLVNISLEVDGVKKSFQHFCEQLFLEAPTPIEEVLPLVLLSDREALTVSLVAEKIFDYLSARDVLSLSSVSKRMHRSINRPTNDILIWKRKLSVDFGESALQSKPGNDSYFSTYRRLVEKRAQERANALRQEDLRRQNFYNQYNYSSSTPFGPGLLPQPIVPWSSIHPAYGSYVAPLFHPQIFTPLFDALRSWLHVPGPGDASVGQNLLFGDGNRRQPDVDEMEAMGIPDDRAGFPGMKRPRGGPGFDGGPGFGFGGGFGGGFV